MLNRLKRLLALFRRPGRYSSACVTGYAVQSRSNEVSRVQEYVKSGKGLQVHGRREGDAGFEVVETGKKPS